MKPRHLLVLATMLLAWVPVGSAQLPPAIVIDVEPLPPIPGYNESSSATISTRVSCAVLNPQHVPPRVDLGHSFSSGWPAGVSLVLDPPRHTIDPATCSDGYATVTTTLRARAEMWTRGGELGKIAIVAYLAGPTTEASANATSEPVRIEVAPLVDVEVRLWDARIEGVGPGAYWLGYGGEDHGTIAIDVFNRGNMPASIMFLGARTDPALDVKLPTSALEVGTDALPSEESPVGHASAQLAIAAPKVAVDADGPVRYPFVLEYLVTPVFEGAPVPRELRFELLVGPLGPLPELPPGRAVPWTTLPALLVALLAAWSIARR